MALKSVYDYNSNWGLTHKRLWGYTGVIWIVTVLIYFAYKYYKNISDTRFVKFVTFFSGLVLVGVNIANFDYLIYNFGKSITHRGIDYYYLATLSSDSRSYNEQLDNKGHISSVYCKLFKKTSIDKAVIFIPGIKGSRLEDNQKQSWLTTAQLLQNTEPFIYKQPLHAIGILDRIVIIPYIYEYRAYYLISSQFSCNNSTYLFSYDWRSKPEENAEKLEEFIIKVTRETNQKPIIIAHSMGGLITRYIEEKNPAIIEKIAYISTPSS
jgi:hypothetical protein